MDSVNTDITDLVLLLRQEKIFIDSEKKYLTELNKQLLKAVEKLYHTCFIRGEQRRNYNDFLTLKPYSSPPACCQRANFLTNIPFVNGYQVLGENEDIYGSFISRLRESPKLLSNCLVIGESINQEMMHTTASILFSSVYSSCLLPEDENYVLILLKNLMEIQLGPSEIPRRLLHKGSCAFSQMYKSYIDAIPQAKVFLTAALHQPIMQLLMEDELFLEIDPYKAAERFPPEERLKRFGEDGTPGYEEALARYRDWTIKKLVNISSRFIESIKEAMCGFPSSLSWLVRTLYNILVQQKLLEAKEASSVCIDLIFDLFLCSAIVTPEPHGIVDAPISHISRFNLIQVAQILQVLAINRWESPDFRLTDLYSHFDKEILSDILDTIMEQDDTEALPVEPVNNGPQAGLTKISCLIPEKHLAILVHFFIKVEENVSADDIISKELNSIFSSVKPHMASLIKTETSDSSAPIGHHVGTSPKRNLLSKVKNTRRSLKNEGWKMEGVTVAEENGSLVSSSSSSSFEEKDDDKWIRGHSFDYITVLAINLNNHAPIECPGLLPEDKVLSSVLPVKPTSRVRMNIVDDDGGVCSAGEITHEKRTRFSLSHDDGSIGNTSDNLEAISEAASNHSVASSLDDVEQVDQPDNLSDMVSANVSGRGTPNVSGRDTPSSMLTDGDEVNRGNEPVRPVANVPVAVAKSASADIDEKFGRFEIKPLIGGDETVSLVSDTWSTDVLASDSENIESAERESMQHQFFDRHLRELDRMHINSSGFVRGSESAGELFETASEAWSTDVLASDSERLAEFDTDDAQSVARSDDTGRSEADVEMVNVEAVRPNPSAEGVTCRRQNEGVRFSLGEESPAKGDAPNDDKGDTDQPMPKYVPVMQVNGQREMLNLSMAAGFIPIKPDEDHSNSGLNDSSMIRSHAEPPGTQTLGRLSLNLSDLPNNGLMPVDQPLLLNSFVTEGMAKICEENMEQPSKQTARKDHRKSLVQDVSVEDSSINLSTTSLISSSSSSGSDGSGSKDKKLLSISGGSEETAKCHATLQACVSVPAGNLVGTGAIPKSISFDKTAERGDREGFYDGDSKLKKGFFKGFKLPGFKNRRKPFSSLQNRNEDSSSKGCSSDYMRRAYSEDSRNPLYEESSDEILEKYRKKTTDASRMDVDVNISLKEPKDEECIIESMDPGSYAFNDAKRKLRRVLSSADFCLFAASHNYHSNTRRPARRGDIVTWLKLQLAEAQNMHTRSLVAQLHETLRCVQLFSEEIRHQLIHTLKEDYNKRSSYIAYLIRCKQKLLLSLSHMEQMYLRIEADTNVVSRSLVSLCVRMFLEKRESQVFTFTDGFTQLTVPDEKVEMVETFLNTLYAELERDAMWLSSTPEQLELAQVTLERTIMSHIYLHALYPNGDGDVSRDQVLHEHISKLSCIISPNHKDLGIPKIYQYECPWPSAQAELACLSAYKTARDKLQCVVSASQVIMNLLSMTHVSSVPAADDFVPVLVYVLIKANPPSLLSTVQYVNLFFERRLEGEDFYWWTQFCSAIEFIKTMDYTP